MVANQWAKPTRPRVENSVNNSFQVEFQVKTHKLFCMVPAGHLQLLEPVL